MSIRVALVSEHASPLAALGGVDAGGQNVHVAALAENLARLGDTVDVYTRRDDPSVPALVAVAPGVTVIHIDAGPASPIPKDDLLPHMAQFSTELRRHWATRRPDVAHGHFWMSGLAAYVAARDLRVPVVQTFHALGVVKRREQGPKDTSPPERLGMESFMVRVFDHILATCTDETFELVRLGADRARITVVPCGVDLATFRPDGRVKRRSNGRRPRVVVVSRMVERKGIGNVVAALASIPDAELIVAGGPDRADLGNDAEAVRLARLARRHGVADRVDFRGRLPRHEVPDLLRSADVVVCAPWYEPFGIVPLEAMACGRPVVATAVGGLVDTVVHDVTGLHVPPRDTDAIAEAVRTLLADPELRRRMGAAGAARAQDRYGWDRVADSTQSCYRRLIRQPATAVVER